MKAGSRKAGAKTVGKHEAGKTDADLNLYTLLAGGFPADRDACAIESLGMLSSLKLASDARVAVQVEKSPESLLLYLACLRAGLVYLPLNTAYREAEVDYFVGDATPDVLVCRPSAEPAMKPVAARHKVAHLFTLGDDRVGTLLSAAAEQPAAFASVPADAERLAAILYTSGTTGRSKDLIISGGYNVYPKEIESYLDELPGVLESAVLGIPDRDFGESVAAVVVPRPAARLDEARIIASLKCRIAGFKVPKRVLVVKELPRNQMGKVQKNLLRARFG